MFTKKKRYLLYLGLILLAGLGWLVWYRQQQRNLPQTHESRRGDVDHPSDNGTVIASPRKSETGAPPTLAPSAFHPSSTWARIQWSIQHPIKAFRQFFLPGGAFPIKVRGVELYGLWSQSPNLPEDLSHLASIRWGRLRRLGLWPAAHVVWEPAREGKTRSWLTEMEAYDACESLLTHLNVLEAAAAQGAASGTAPARLVYRVLHIEELEAQKPRLYRLRSRKRARAIRQIEMDSREAFVERLQRRFGLVEEDSGTGWVPGRFIHYDRANRQNGWIVVSPQRALVARVGSSEARILASLIQPRDTDLSGKRGGITTDRFEDVLGRIALWNGTQDIAEAVGQLEDLVASGKRTIDGQFFISVALATIGVLLAIFAYPHLNLWQIAALILLAAASGAFWFHTRHKTSFWIWFGWLLFVAALVAVFASSWVLSWLHALIQFMRSHV